MSAILAQLAKDELDCLKSAAFLVYSVATIGVVVGVGLEHKRFSDRVQQIGWKILVIALAIEVAFGVFIFAVDSEVSRRQEREILALEIALAPRQIEAKSRSTLERELAPLAGKRVLIGSYQLDVEAARLGNQLFDILKAAGMAPNAAELMTIGGAPSIAMSVRVTGRDGPTVAALLKALADSGLRVSPENPFPSGLQKFGPPVSGEFDAHIFVGVKPLTP